MAPESEENYTPEFVQALRGQLNDVREEISAIWSKMWPAPGQKKGPDAVTRMQLEAQIGPLEARETELQGQISKYLWLLPPVS